MDIALYHKPLTFTLSYKTWPLSSFFFMGKSDAIHQGKGGELLFFLFVLGDSSGRELQLFDMNQLPSGGFQFAKASHLSPTEGLHSSQFAF